ncbi:hypothetical protein TMatcc_000962 [Talaromyces marneffei ATCC 18224]
MTFMISKFCSACNGRVFHHSTFGFSHIDNHRSVLARLIILISTTHLHFDLFPIFKLQHPSTHNRVLA